MQWKDSFWKTTDSRGNTEKLKFLLSELEVREMFQK